VRRTDLAIVPARAALGATMLYHGLAKLRGDGPAQHAGFFEALGFRPGRSWAIAAGVAEVVTGVTAILGIGSRVGALAALATQAAAVKRVHGPKGFDNTSGGYEFNAALMAIALGMLVAGPGAPSLHRLVERRLVGRAPRSAWRTLARARPRRRMALRAVEAFG
jgi:putative oxidoreductase